MSYRLTIHCSFILCNKNMAIYDICVNNTTNITIRSFRGYNILFMWKNMNEKRVENFWFKDLAMLFQAKNQLSCFFCVTNSVKPKRKVQMSSSDLGTLVLVTTIVCEMRVEIVFLGICVLITAVLHVGKNCS